MTESREVHGPKGNQRYIIFAFALIFAYVLVRCATKAAMRPFWADELCTWVVTRQPNLQVVWHALARAADGHPPLYYAIERISSKLISSDEIAFRIVECHGNLGQAEAAARS